MLMYNGCLVICLVQRSLYILSNKMNGSYDMEFKKT